MQGQKTKIIAETCQLIATEGFEHFSMRKLTQRMQVSAPLIYYYFKDKEALIQACFFWMIGSITQAIAPLTAIKDPHERLKERITFQFTHAREVVFLHKYFLHYYKERNNGPSQELPVDAYRDIHDIIVYGQSQGQFTTAQPNIDARIIAHLLNGFIIEYFPKPIPQEVRDRITNFMIAGLK